MFSGSANIIYKKSRTCTPIFKGKNVVLYSSFQPPKAAAQATVSGFSNMKPEPWAGRGLTNGFCRPRLPTARHGRLQALGLSRHITILNSNLLDHIADEPLPGACFDPRLWPTYPPVVHRGSTHNELQSFTDWWSRDGIASHILTSRLNPSVLGCLPIANERLGHRRSARVVYNTLRHQCGAGDYSAVMVIEARLRQLRCLPTRGGVRIADFISVWRTSLNQMDAAGFLPGIRQLLAILADGLPHSTVAFINLYDTIMSSLNEPNEQLLPNIHLLFDRIINIENNIQRNRIMNPSPRRPPPTTLPSTVPPAPLSSSATALTPITAPQQSTLCCTNCGRSGHGSPTCFQTGGAMEGRRDEYLASRTARPVAHIAEVDDS